MSRLNCSVNFKTHVITLFVLCQCYLYGVNMFELINVCKNIGGLYLCHFVRLMLQIEMMYIAQLVELCFLL